MISRSGQLNFAYRDTLCTCGESRMQAHGHCNQWVRSVPTAWKACSLAVYAFQTQSAKARIDIGIYCLESQTVMTGGRGGCIPWGEVCSHRMESVECDTDISACKKQRQSNCIKFVSDSFRIRLAWTLRKDGRHKSRSLNEVQHINARLALVL